MKQNLLVLYQCMLRDCMGAKKVAKARFKKLKALYESVYSLVHNEKEAKRIAISYIRTIKALQS